MSALKIASVALFALTVSACGSSSDTPSTSTQDDSPSPGTPSTGTSTDPDTTEVTDSSANPDQPEPGSGITLAISKPAYQGELSFASMMSVDLDPFLAEKGLRSVNVGHVLSHDGTSVRLEITTEDSYNAFAMAEVGTDTGVMQWLATDIAPTTRLLFDANNQPVAVAGVACEPVSYIQVFEHSLVDLSSLVPSDRCIAEYIQVSDNGNVVLFNTYDPLTGTQYLAPDFLLNAYTLDTASLVELPGVEVDKSGVTLETFRSYESYLSADGSQYLRKTWWKGTDANGGTIDQVGAVFWDTATGTWQTRGIADDLRGCIITENVGCVPQYSYVMSQDGSVQYSQVPTDQLFNSDSGGPFSAFVSYVERSDATSSAPVVVPGVENVGSMATNHDGSVLLYQALIDSESGMQGYTLYQPESDTRFSLSRALNACPETDDSGNAIDADSCDYTSAPASITNDAVSFTADGSSLIIRAVSRISEGFEQEVDNFVIDVDTGATYSVPNNYSSNPDDISADAAVFIGTSDYPAYDLLIGRR